MASLNRPITKGEDMSVYSVKTEVINRLNLKHGKVKLAIHKPIQADLPDTAQNSLLIKISLVNGIFHHNEGFREHLLSEVRNALIQMRIISREDLQESMVRPRRLISTPDGMFVLIYLKLGVDVTDRAVHWKE